MGIGGVNVDEARVRLQRREYEAKIGEYVMSIIWMNLGILLSVGIASFFITWAALLLCGDNESARLCVAGLMPPLCMGVGLLTGIICPIFN
jgi:hypothetical protein